MTIEELTEKHNSLVQYLRMREQHHSIELAALQGDIDSLLARVAALESSTIAIE